MTAARSWRSISGLPLSRSFSPSRSSPGSFVPIVPGHAIYNPFCWVGLLVISRLDYHVISGLSTSAGNCEPSLRRMFFIVGLLVTGARLSFP